MGMRNVTVLYIYELKKILMRRISWITMIFITAFIFFSLILEVCLESRLFLVGQQQVTLRGIEYLIQRKECLERLNGQKIEDSMLKTLNDFQVYQDAQSDIDAAVHEQMRKSEIGQFIYWITKDGNLAYEIDEKTLYQMRTEGQQVNWYNQQLNKEEMNYWLSQEEKIEKPFVYGYAHGWEKILQEFQGLNMMLVLAIVICLSNMFSEEHIRKTDQLILSSRCGKKTVFLSKIAAGITLGFGIGIIFLLTAIFSTLGIYGAEGADVAIQIIMPICAYNITVLQAVLLMGVIYVVSAVFYSVITMFLSEALNNSVAVMGVMVGGTLFTVLTSLPYNWGLISRVYELIPTVLLNMEKLYYGKLIPIFGTYVTNFKVAPLVYIVISIGFVLGGKSIHDNYQVNG